MRRSTHKSVSVRLVAIHLNKLWSLKIMARDSSGRLCREGREWVAICYLPAERTCCGHQILQRLKGATPADMKGGGDEFGDERRRRW